jgi:hypothetical protein
MLGFARSGQPAFDNSIRRTTAHSFVQWWLVLVCWRVPLPQQSALLRCIYLFTAVMTRVCSEAVRHWAVAGHDIPSLCACSGLVCVNGMHWVVCWQCVVGRQCGCRNEGTSWYQLVRNDKGAFVCVCVTACGDSHGMGAVCVRQRCVHHAAAVAHNLHPTLAACLKLSTSGINQSPACDRRTVLCHCRARQQARCAEGVGVQGKGEAEHRDCRWRPHTVSHLWLSVC